VNDLGSPELSFLFIQMGLSWNQQFTGRKVRDFLFAYQMLGLQIFGIEPQKTISIGDDLKHTVAAKRAGIFSVGALWGTLDREALIASKPDALARL